MAGRIHRQRVVRMVIGETELPRRQSDKLTYAGNLENLAAVENRAIAIVLCRRYLRRRVVDALVAEERPDAIVHFAAESHVDRSLLSPEPVVRTHFNGTFTMLEAGSATGSRGSCMFRRRVYGSLERRRRGGREFIR